jgi:dCTP deaminase
MILSDKQIIEAVADGRLEFCPPLRDDNLRPAGVRVHLGSELLVPCAGQIVDLQTPARLDYDHIDLLKSPFVLAPGGFVLANTIEKIRCSPALLITLEGRSTIARLGLTVHNTASVLDVSPGEYFAPVLEIVNHGTMSIVLRPAIPIAMLCFQEITEPASSSRFHDQYRDQIEIRPPELSRGASFYSS